MRGSIKYKETYFFNDTTIKKKNYYIRSNSSIFEGISVQITLKSGSRGTPSKNSPSKIQIFPSLMNPYLQNSLEKKIKFTEQYIYIVHASSKQVWV